MKKKYCTKCSEKLFGKERKPDIDVFKMFENLDPGFIESGFMCDECGLMMIKKTEDGEMKVMKNSNEKKLLDWENY